MDFNEFEPVELTPGLNLVCSPCRTKEDVLRWISLRYTGDHGTLTQAKVSYANNTKTVTMNYTSQGWLFND